MTDNKTMSGKVTYAGPHKFLQGSYSISLTDSSGNKTYFQGKGEASCKRDDFVEIEYTPMSSESNGKTYINNVVSKITIKKAKSGDSSYSEVRSNVDAGNMVSFAKDIVIACIKKEVSIEQLHGQVKGLTKTCTEAFLEAKLLLEGKNQTEVPKEEEIPVVKPGQPDPSELPNY